MTFFSAFKLSRPAWGATNFWCFRLSILPFAFIILFLYIFVPVFSTILAHSWKLTAGIFGCADVSNHQTPDNMTMYPNLTDADIVEQSNFRTKEEHQAISSTEVQEADTRQPESTDGQDQYLKNIDSAVLVDYVPSTCGSVSDIRDVVPICLQIKFAEPFKVLYSAGKLVFDPHQYLKTITESTHYTWWAIHYAVVSIIAPHASQLRFIARDVLGYIDPTSTTPLTLCLLVTSPIEATRQSWMAKQIKDADGPNVHVLDIVHIGVHVSTSQEAIIAVPLCPMGSVADRVCERDLVLTEVYDVLRMVVCALARARIAGVQYMQFKLDYLLIDGMVSNKFDLSMTNLILGGHHALQKSDKPPCTFLELRAFPVSQSEKGIFRKAVAHSLHVLNPKLLNEAGFSLLLLLEVLEKPSRHLSWNLVLTACGMGI